MIHAVKGFGIVSKAKIDIFLELSCFFNDSVDIGNLISGSSAFSQHSLNIWKFTLHILLKPGLENFDHYFASVWDECSCVVVWTLFSIAFLWDWNKKWSFPVLWPLLSFPNLMTLLYGTLNCRLKIYVVPLEYFKLFYLKNKTIYIITKCKVYKSYPS